MVHQGYQLRLETSTIRIKIYGFTAARTCSIKIYHCIMFIAVYISNLSDSFSLNWMIDKGTDKCLSGFWGNISVLCCLWTGPIFYLLTVASVSTFLTDFHRKILRWKFGIELLSIQAGQRKTWWHKIMMSLHSQLLELWVLYIYIFFYIFNL